MDDAIAAFYVRLGREALPALAGGLKSTTFRRGDVLSVPYGPPFTRPMPLVGQSDGGAAVKARMIASKAAAKSRRPQGGPETSCRFESLAGRLLLAANSIRRRLAASGPRG